MKKIDTQMQTTKATHLKCARSETPPEIPFASLANWAALRTGRFLLCALLYRKPLAALFATWREFTELTPHPPLVF
ncbi:hypothetical protein QS306_12520 [Paraburkholderia bonniea]|uniref:hypothetical protein n=1 Tax=Paraburkholderia bonniea TaxID=2152891 RepID=UPI001291FD09|nr:hypothetical protein [Paraburkholderia bonniea]WJF89915.1 hypothetical protein QS306_12520 [Paraburkholderia bonniea]WJF93229.1 hypothetical protein QS308_12530 [Paraburkholderia bonniea]